ncbi:MAG: hypothetical protein HC769_07240 [Cyanobacteria bacterium CRU_2_1]|nr:hypothetical protein [Cyanobacteria bacterium CRU_2_1]
MRVPHYIVYSRYTQRSRYFKLEGGLYQEQVLSQQNPLIWLAELEIGLGIWQGEFEGVPGSWLRWCNQAGEWLLTDTEQAQLAEEQARLAKEQAQLAEERERLAKEQAQAQVWQAAQNLLATGMPIEQVITLLGLSDVQAQQLRSSD